jgi:hypothetical protein
VCPVFCLIVVVFREGVERSECDKKKKGREGGGSV